MTKHFQYIKQLLLKLSTSFDLTSINYIVKSWILKGSNVVKNGEFSASWTTTIYERFSLEYSCAKEEFKCTDFTESSATETTTT